jgi:hypothetical protein
LCGKRSAKSKIFFFEFKREQRGGLKNWLHSAL